VGGWRAKVSDRVITHRPPSGTGSKWSGAMLFSAQVAWSMKRAAVNSIPPQGRAFDRLEALPERIRSVPQERSPGELLLWLWAQLVAVA